MPMFKRSMAFLLLILALVAGVSLYQYHEAEQAVPLRLEGTEAEGAAAQAAAEAEAQDRRQVAIYVTGEVNSPGVVYLGVGQRVAEAIEICGGLLPTADSNKVNMAETVKDGMHVIVPKMPEIGAGGTGSSGGNGNSSSGNSNGVNAGSSSGRTGTAGKSTAAAATGAGELVNINQASVEELTKLKGIGTAMAQRIVEYREAHGGFQKAEELQKIKGIGKAKFEKLREQVTL